MWYNHLYELPDRFKSAIVKAVVLTDRVLTGGLREDTEELGRNVGGDLVFLTLDRYLHEDIRWLLRDIRKDGIVMWENGGVTDDYKQLLCNGIK